MWGDAEEEMGHVDVFLPETERTLCWQQEGNSESGLFLNVEDPSRLCRGEPPGGLLINFTLSQGSSPLPLCTRDPHHHPSPSQPDLYAYSTLLILPCSWLNPMGMGRLICSIPHVTPVLGMCLPTGDIAETSVMDR